MRKASINPKLIHDTIEISHRLRYRGLTSGLGGGISLLIPHSKKVLIKGWEVASEDVRREDLALVDLKGVQLNGVKPCLETPLHLEVLKARKDIGAVIHAHPPYATALGNIRPKLDYEQLKHYGFLQAAAFTPFADPGSKDLAEIVARPFREDKAFCVFMEDHGVTVVGSDLYSAYYRLDFLEGTAKTFILTLLLNRAIGPFERSAFGPSSP